jgi:hypothetical protein
MAEYARIDTCRVFARDLLRKFLEKDATPREHVNNLSLSLFCLGEWQRYVMTVWVSKVVANLSCGFQR